MPDASRVIYDELLTINLNNIFVKSNILLFDLAGTLINTNLANFLAYKEACYKILGISLSFSPRRFNLIFLEHILKSENIDIKYDILVKIKSLKDEIYNNFIDQTIVNKNLKRIIINFYKTNKIFLITNANKNRVFQLLKYHSLSAYFFKVFINSSLNKYQSIIKTYNLNPNDLVVFENEAIEIQNALDAGILFKNIVKVKI